MERYGEENTQSFLETFACVRSLEEFEFLTKKAIVMEKKDLCRTYIAVENRKLLGFFTLGMKCTTVPDSAWENKKFFSKIGINPNNNVIQCYLLAQLCRSDISKKGFGIELVKEAFRVLSEAKKLIGCRSVRLDCKDVLLEYYESLGFVFIRKNEDGDLNQMLAVM